MNDAHKMLGFFYRAVAVVFIPFLTSCGGGGGGIPNQPPVFAISSQHILLEGISGLTLVATDANSTSIRNYCL